MAFQGEEVGECFVYKSLKELEKVLFGKMNLENSHEGEKEAELRFH